LYKIIPEKRKGISKDEKNVRKRCRNRNGQSKKRRIYRISEAKHAEMTSFDK